MNLPNKITIARICMIPIFVLVFFLENIPFHYGIAAVIFLVAALTDALDGYIARKYNLITNLGKFLDPIADKVLVSVAMVLTIALKAELFPQFGAAQTAIYITTAVAVCVILARELIISAFRQIAASNGVVLAADTLGKYKTVLQDAALFVLLLSADVVGTFGSVLAWIGFGLFMLATVLTVWSGISYVVNNREVLEDKTEETEQPLLDEEEEKIEE